MSALNSLPAFAMRNRAVVLTVIGLLVAWGIVQWMNAPRREDPEIRIRTCAVTVLWPGASAVKVEQLVADPIETNVATLEEVRVVRSRCTTGLAAIYVDLKDSITDTDAVWDKVRAEVAGVTLPEGAREPDVNTNFGDTAAMVIGLYQSPASAGSSPATHTYSLRELDVFSDQLKDELKQLPAVARVDRIGVRDEVIYVEADMRRWSQLELTLDDLRDIVSARNIVAPGGTVHTDSASFSVRPTGELERVGELSGVIVAEHDGGLPVTLEDLGLTARRTYADPPRQTVRVGDNDGSYAAVAVSLTMENGQNVVVLGEQVRELLARKDSFLPPDVELAVLSDQPQSVDRLVRDFATNLLQAIVIVALVAFLILGLRIAMVMAAAIPVVILAGFGLVRVFGVELEQMSIAALIISLGMLVDNAIEVCDNVHRLLGDGYTRIRAATVGAAQVAFPVLIATTTTVFAFLPMLTLPGGTGEYIYSLPVVVAVTLLLSFFVAMTLTTIMAYWLIRPGHGSSPIGLLFRLISLPFRLRAKTDNHAGKGAESSHRPRLTGAQRLYGRIASLTLRTQPIAILIAVGLFAGSLNLLMSGAIGTQFFPPTTRTQFAIDVTLPEGVPISRTQATVDELEAQLRWLSTHRADGTELATPRLTNYVTYVGEGGPRFFLSLETMPPTPGYAQIAVNTATPEDVRTLIDDIRQLASERIADARVVPVRLMFGPPVKYPISMRIYGDDLEQLRNAAGELEQILRETNGTWDVNNNWGNLGYELVVDTDEARAKYAGVVPATVAQSLNAYFSGHYLTTYREGDHQIPVYFRVPPEQRETLDPAWSAYVEGTHGKIPIDQVADLSTRQVITRFERRDQSRMIEVRCQIDSSLLSSKVLAAAQPRIDAFTARLTATPDMRLEMSGEQAETAESTGNLSVAFGISFVLIIMTLMIKYNAFSKVGIILFTLPLATTGAFFGLWVTGEPMSFMAQLGLLSLAGIVLNAAIVLIEFVEMLIKNKLQAGEDLASDGQRSYGGLTRDGFRRCVIDGSALRITPIMLTTLTTVGGLVPLYLFGGDMWRPLAVVLIYGLLLAAVLTLLVLPALYAFCVEVLRMRVFNQTKEEREAIRAAEAEAQVTD